MNNFQSNFEQFAININDIIPKQTRQEMFTVSIIPRRTNKNTALNLRQEPRICRLIVVKVSNLSCSSCCSLLREQRSTSLAHTS